MSEIKFLKSPFREDAPATWRAFYGKKNWCIATIAQLSEPLIPGRPFRACIYERNEKGRILCEFTKNSPTFEWAELWATQHIEDALNGSLSFSAYRY